jgi:dTDP-4-dehydrorhamnose 3,5-epimerase
VVSRQRDVVAAAERTRVMKLIELSIPGLYALESPVHGDNRGFFREWFKHDDFEQAGVDFQVQQANLSLSARNVVRGLHYSMAPEGQAKLVTCVLGELDDVIVDIRIGSPRFGCVEVVHLAADKGLSVLLPRDVAHGYCATSDLAALSYLISSPFNAPMELEINPFDEEIGVSWPLSGEPILSAKDTAAPSLERRRAAKQLPIFP